MNEGLSLALCAAYVLVRRVFLYIILIHCIFWAHREVRPARTWIFFHFVRGVRPRAPRLISTSHFQIRHPQNVYTNNYNKIE
jgi:hypothetical protein